jgi:hypothetical protein
MANNRNDPNQHPDEALPAVSEPSKRGRPRGALTTRRNPDGLTPRQRIAVDALLQETTIARAATFAGVSLRTLQRWMTEPMFQRAYHGARRAAYGQSVGLMQRYSPVAVKVLVELATDTNITAAARVAAATTLLRFGREGIELDDLSLRIDALEADAQ